MAIDDSHRYVEKPKPRHNYDSVSQRASAPKPKLNKSTFDRVLERSQFVQRMSVVKPNPHVLQERAVHESREQRDRKEDERRKDKQEEKKQLQQEDGKRTDSSGLTQQRVMGKGGKKGGGSYGGSGGSGHPGYGARRRSLDKLKKLADKRVYKGVAKKVFSKELKRATLKNAGHIPKRLSQDVLNKLVRSIKIGFNKDGDKELRLDLHEEVFASLRLRLVSKRGKVVVHFLTENAGVRKLFEHESERIRDALIERGVEVEDIVVG